MTTNLKSKINELRDNIHAILESPTDVKSIRAQIDQCVRLDGDAIRELASLKDQNIFFVQNASIQALMVHCSSALKTLHELENMAENKEALDTDTYLKRQLKKSTLPEIIDKIKRKAHLMVSNLELCKADKARILGMKRTTYINQLKLIENKHSVPEKNSPGKRDKN